MKMVKTRRVKRIAKRAWPGTFFDHQSIRIDIDFTNQGGDNED
jgi:hypothetical protein